MIYLRNNTTEAQWLEDPQTGIRRRVEADGLARVTEQMADHTLATQPSTWVRVVAIALAPPKPAGPGDLP